MLQVYNVGGKMNKKEILEAVRELKKDKRNFNQSVDLIINFQNFDSKKDSINNFLTLPNKVRDSKICGFTNKKLEIDTVKESEFKNYDKKKIKKLAKKYDFFTASPELMPKVASNFGKYLGPRGKMPSPKQGLIKDDTDKLKNKLDKLVKIKNDGPSVKFSVGREDLDEEKIVENILASYKSILNEIAENKIKNVLIKLTMSKPIKIKNGKK